MLQHIEGELRDIVYSAATEFIMQNDRSKFDSVFTVIEDFTLNHNGIIGGVNGINMLAGVPKSKDSYMYEIYIADVENNARALADLLYNSEHKYVNKDTLRLETKLRNRIYELWIDARLIARLYALADYRGIKLFLLLNPVRAYGYFPGESIDLNNESQKERKIYVMSSEIQLLDIYRRLYNPYPTREVISYDTYDVLLDYENKLYNVIAEDIITRASGIEQDIMSVTRAEGGDDTAHGAAQSLHSAIPIIAKKLIPELSKINSTTVIVGDYALRQIMPNYPYQERLQILTTESMENMKKLLTSMIANDKDIKRSVPAGAKITGIKYPLNLPNDIMMEKFSLYLDSGGSQAYICDVFNSPSYELIPYITINGVGGGTSNVAAIKYANLVVCLRFKFIDLYVSRLINNIREGKDEFIIKKINQIARTVKMVREKLLKTINNGPLDVFSVDYEKYEGTFVKPNVMLRTKIAELLGGKKIHYNYFPARESGKTIDSLHF